MSKDFKVCQYCQEPVYTHHEVCRNCGAVNKDVNIAYNVASTKDRGVAAIIDIIIMIGLIMIGSVIKLAKFIGFKLVVVVGVMTILAIIAYTVNVWRTSSSSIGKNLVGLKVVNKSNGVGLGFIKMILRETIGKAVSGVLLCAGFIMIYFTDSHQGLHDRFVKSVVAGKHVK